MSKYLHTLDGQQVDDLLAKYQPEDDTETSNNTNNETR